MCESSSSMKRLHLNDKKLRSIVIKLGNDTKKVLRKSKMSNVLTHLLLVIEGYREGYLLDGCSMTCKDINDLLQSLRDAFISVDIQLQSPLIAIMMGPLLDDFLIIRSDTLQRKLVELSTAECSMPLIVDINCSVPYICDDEEVQRIKLCLHDTFKDIWQSSAYSFSVTGDNSFHRIVGFPLLAGWLLGYPCVYRSTSQPINPDAENRQEKDTDNRQPSGGNSLSMVCLRKCSVTASINGVVHSIIHSKGNSTSGNSDKYNTSSTGYCNSSDTHSTSHNSYNSQNTIDLFEFTIPVDLTSEGKQAHSFLNTWLVTRRKALAHLCSSPLADEMFLKLVDRCLIESEDVILPSLTL